MSNPLIAAYFDAWNAHDGDALVRLFAPEGTYEDPTTRGPIPCAHLPNLLNLLTAAFPDLRFECVSETGTDTLRAVEWIMHGHNLGAFRPGLNPTQQPVALKGVDVFEVSGDHIRSVRGYFDQQSLFEQMGLMVLIQPFEQGLAKFGYSMRVASSNPKPPGIIALTWIQGANEHEKERIRAHSRQNVQDFVAEPGFISIITGFTGLRGFTVTAWEDEASMRLALSKHHAVAMRELFSENFVASVWTSVWQPTRINRLWVRCPACGALEDVSDDHRACTQCAAPLPARPEFW